MSALPETMRAIVLREPGAATRLEEVRVPEPGPEEALVRVGACGMGLTVRDKLWRIDTGKLPRIPGHELVGRVAAAGADCGLRVGQRVVAYYYLHCAECARCRQGRESLCLRPGGRIGEDVDGGFAEYVVLPSRNLIPVEDDAVGDVDLTVTCDALGTSVHVVGLTDLGEGSTVLVVGAAGGVGIHLVQLARHRGAEVLAVDLGEEKLAALAELGVTAIDGQDPGWAKRLHNRVDVAVDFISDTETLVACYATLRNGGVLLRMVGYRPVSLDALPASLGAGERWIVGSKYCSTDELAAAVGLLSAGIVTPRVTEVRPLEGLTELCEMIDRRALLGRAAITL